MALSRFARDFAAEIAQHDWSDAPYRRDRAGHDRSRDSKSGAQVLSDSEIESLLTNVMWVTAQVLGYHDPNFDVFEFAEACGVNIRTSRGAKSGVIDAGLRAPYGRYMRPGTWEFDPVTEVVTTETSDFYHATEKCWDFQRGYRGARLIKFNVEEVPARWKPCKCMTVDQL
ncbi:hypothetical protein ACIBJF_17335 [Streptomyces sp. NPDC050743]|uniref:hypothetical protein n=1 Tax=Streptomyces sp. NPDC050743 TaxID=3365634 RepID=UPI0037AA29CE